PVFTVRSESPMRLFVSFCCLTIAAVAFPAQSMAEEQPAARVSFARDIRPILSDACFQCHGPDKNQRQADVRLDVKDDLYHDRGGYTLIVPGKVEDSELLSRLVETDPTARMPPPKSARQLTPTELDLIKRWISEGAQWQGHWAYVPPE